MQRIEQPEELTPQLEARTIHLRQQAMEVLQLLPQVPQEMIAALQAATAQGALADLVPPISTSSPKRSRNCLKPSTFRRASTKCPDTWRSGWKFCD